MFGSQDYPSNDAYSLPAVGFASNLSHTIIRENDGESMHSLQSSSTIEDLTDEELALEGSPWAKEGMVSRKHYVDPGGKRAKDKAWKSMFAVVQKGNMQMFTFGESGSSRSGPITVGGGNWMVSS